jgi:hypothetical protein
LVRGNVWPRKVVFSLDTTGVLNFLTYYFFINIL